MKIAEYRRPKEGFLTFDHVSIFSRRTSRPRKRKYYSVPVRTSVHTSATLRLLNTFINFVGISHFAGTVMAAPLGHGRLDSVKWTTRARERRSRGTQSSLRMHHRAQNTTYTRSLGLASVSREKDRHRGTLEN